MRKILFAGVAIVVLGSAAMLAVYLTSSEGDGAPASAPAAPVPVKPSPDLSRYAAGSEGAPRPMEYAPLPPGPPPGSWEAIKPVARPAALGRVGVALHRGLQELQPRLAGCMESAPLSGAGSLTSVKEEYRTVQDAGTPVLVLQIQELRDEVKIVDAPVEARGGASDAALACAQGLLRGQTFPVPGAAAGSRHRLLFPLIP